MFNTGGWSIDNHMTNMETTVQVFICLQDWWVIEKRRQNIEAIDVVEKALENLKIDNAK